MFEDKIKQIDQLKKEIDNYRPMDEAIITQLKQYYRIGLTYSSNALEGNTLTESETKVVLEDGITIGGKPLKDHLEAIGHSDAYSLIFYLIDKQTILEQDILEIHRLLYSHINTDNAGKYRTKNVIITGTEFIPPKPDNIPALMKELIDKLPALKEKHHPVEFSALLHKELVTIHPFIDGNGRTARLLMNLALLQAGYVVTIIPPILRNDYICALKLAQVEPKDDKPFINFISEVVYESMKDYMRIIEALK
ncbi:MAG: Fic family protein [Vampirovibrionia bacterium]